MYIPVQLTDKCRQVALTHNVGCKHEASSAIDHFGCSGTPPSVFINLTMSVPLYELSNTTYIRLASEDLIVCLYLRAVLTEKWEAKEYIICLCYSISVIVYRQTCTLYIKTGSNTEYFSITIMVNFAKVNGTKDRLLKHQLSLIGS